MKLILLLLVFTTLDVNSEAQAEVVSIAPIKIGATLALSGKLAFIGKEERDGLIMAVEQVNANGGIDGRKLELLLEDNRGETKSAVSGVNKLLAIDRVDVVFSAFTHVTQAIKDIVARRGKTLFYASSLGSIARGNPRFFRDYFDAGQSGTAIANALLASGVKKIAILTEINDACEEYETHIRKVIQTTKVEVVKREAYLPGENDFKALLLKIRSQTPDGIVFCTWRDTHLVMRQLKQLGMIDIPTYHFVAPFLPVADTAELKTLYERNGLVSSWYGFVEETRQVKQRAFIEKFEKRFNRRPRPDAAFAYDNVLLLSEALSKCPIKQSVDQNCVARMIKQSKFDGVAGRLEFSSEGLSNREVPLIRVQGGVWVVDLGI